MTQPLTRRVLDALKLKPMTAAELAQCLMRSEAYIRTTLRRLSVGNKVMRCGVGRWPQWRLPGGPALGKTSIPRFRWASKKHRRPWVEMFD